MQAATLRAFDITRSNLFKNFQKRFSNTGYIFGLAAAQYDLSRGCDIEDMPIHQS